MIIQTLIVNGHEFQDSAQTPGEAEANARSAAKANEYISADDGKVPF